MKIAIYLICTCEFCDPMRTSITFGVWLLSFFVINNRMRKPVSKPFVLLPNFCILSLLLSEITAEQLWNLNWIDYWTINIFFCWNSYNLTFCCDRHSKHSLKYWGNIHRHSLALHLKVPQTSSATTNRSWTSWRATA